MPKLILIMAVTSDGKIAKATEQTSTDWTSGADKKMFIEETKKAGVIIMGDTTYLTIGKPLPNRLNKIMTLTPEKYQEQNIPNILEFTNTQPKELLKELEERGFKEVILGGGATINGLFLKENLIDEIWLTIEPKLFGEGIPLFARADVNLDLELIENKQLDKNVLQLRYKVIK